MNDEFYIGWQAKAPVATGRLVRRAVVLLLLGAVALAGTVAIAQRTIGSAVFEWGHVKEFTGILRSEPVPHLLIPRADAPGAFTNFYLVNPFKFGFDPDAAGQFDGQQVVLRGTLIYRRDQRMIEVVPNSVSAAVEKVTPDISAPPEILGERTFTGEIVDSKCWLGVMNPGQLKPHRACAVRCISGGIPPILLVRQTNGSSVHLLLVGRSGQSVNKDVLGMVAEPVEITGELVRQGEILTLRSDPATYRRL
jgi:hypothetical protein